MSQRRMVTIDGNEATSSVAHRTNEVCAIYPITPSSNMGEFADEWSAQGRKNIWGTIPDVIEMQSEGGAAGAVHGSLQAGALTTTFTASQGLLLMIPNMYKIAGELTSTVFHVSARTVATHALSIFGDHSDVYSCRQTGWAMLSSGSVQEAHDMACIAQAATLKARVPFIHFFDGFRTSHEVAKMEELTDDDLHHMMDEEAIAAHRDRSLSPDHPTIRGTAQNPDAYFQAREASEPFYRKCPSIVIDTMNQFAKLTGRQYKPFDYIGDPNAENIVILMGSGGEAVQEYVEWANKNGQKIGAVKVRLYRPFSAQHLFDVIPKSVKKISVLDRTKEPGSTGDPLYLDIVTAFAEARANGSSQFNDPAILAGRYGLSSKEFNAAMIKAIYDNMEQSSSKSHFTIGIKDDVSNSSLDFDHDFDIEPDSVVRGVFFGLGADGTVGANKNSIKIIGEETNNNAQGYFVYDSKKAGAVTISHLRFGPDPIRSTYLIRKANFVACHQWVFLEKYDMLRYAIPGATFLVNSPYSTEETWNHLPKEVQQDIIDKNLKFYTIDAYSVAKETRMGARINTIMQTCFFAISGVLPKDEAIDQIKKAIKKTYGIKGDEIVQLNYNAVDRTIENLHQVEYPDKVTSTFSRPPIVSPNAPEYIREVTSKMMLGDGDQLPVSAFSVDGTFETATTQWEKRNIALEIPTWDPSICIQCNKCAMVCPHAAIRPKVFEENQLKDAPSTFKSVAYKAKDFKGMMYSLQVAPEDCTGCKLCVRTCPSKDKANPKHKALEMAKQMPLREQERENYSFFLNIPDVDRTKVSQNVKGSQFLQPLFEYSGACSGCGETAYVKLMSQLFGDRLYISNATGCSSIYGGNLPTTPYAQDKNGRGPTWSNSLFEDNAEFGFGFRLAVDQNERYAQHLLQTLSTDIGSEIVDGILKADQSNEAGIRDQRERVSKLRERLREINKPLAANLNNVADYLVRKSVWVLGGDGWAFDIGYGGLDHVLSMPRDVNILVVDTGVYSNTGGQASKSTPLAATAKFAMGGREVARKDLGMMAMSYGHCYVAQIALGAKDSQTVKAFVEAESYNGPSIIIAYASCIAHGYNLEDGLDHQKMAVDCGYYPLYRYDPRRVDNNENPLQLDSGEPTMTFEQWATTETRFKMLLKSQPERAKMLLNNAQKAVQQRLQIYKHMSGMSSENNA
jgi:pyruvate-ferredoxin/flavodoxin oxidoreductase